MSGNAEGSLKQIFIFETGSLFDEVDRILMQARELQQLSKEDIDAIFRAMHTTKSSASMMGYELLSGLMHRVEDLFSLCREKPIDPSLLPLILQLVERVSDYLRESMVLMRKDDFQEIDPADCLLQCDELIDQLKVAKVVHKQDDELYIRLIFENGCKMENVRAYMIAMQLKSLASAIEYYPRELEGNEQSTQFIKDNGFYLLIKSEQPKRIMKQLERSLYIQKIEMITKADFEKYVDNGRIEIQPELNGNTSLLAVSLDKLDKLQDLSQEMIIADSIMQSQLRQLNNPVMQDTYHQLFDKLVLSLEGVVMSLRLVSVSSLLPKLNRVIRDISKKMHKEIELTVHGEQLELDKEIVDALFDPLMHLLRNAIDHGIEDEASRLAQGKSVTGKISLSFENTGSEVKIEISDDGRGLDRQKILELAKTRNLLQKDHDYSDSEIFELVLLPGFSTRQVANEFSGRGVGMDVVKQMVNHFGGHVEIVSHENQGTIFTIYLPISLSIINSLIFQSTKYQFALPIYSVTHFLDKKDAVITKIAHQYMLSCDDELIPIYSLSHFFEDTPQTEDIIVVINSANLKMALTVKQISGYQQIVEKRLPQLMDTFYKESTGISGCTLLGDGSICLTLHANHFIKACLKRGNTDE